MKNPIRAKYFSTKNGAKRRGISFTLTLEEFTEIVSQQNYLDYSGSEKHSLHLDRIDPTKGYEVGNIQILTCSENVAKGNRERFVNKYWLAEEDPF